MAIDQAGVAVKYAQERLFQRYKIPRLNEGVDALREVIDRIDKAASANLGSSLIDSLKEFFNIYDTDKKERLTKEQFLGFLKILCSFIFQVNITHEQAESLYLVVDENDDGFIQFDEIVRVKEKSEKNKVDTDDKPEESGSDSDDEETENFIERLVSAVTKQDEMFDEFEEQLDVEDDLKKALASVFEDLKKKIWFTNLTA